MPSDPVISVENLGKKYRIQANVTISGSIAKLIKNDIAPLPFPLPALLSGLRHKYDDVRGKGFFAQTRRERRAYPAVDL